MPKPIIAAFDFDGTITTRDSLLPFLFFCKGMSTTLKKLLCLTPLFIKYVLGLTSRQKTKEKVLAAFFKGTSAEEMADWGKAYAASHALNHLVRPQMLEKIKWHQQQGHLCLIISASIDTYLEPWGDKMGFDHVICSRLDYDAEGNITGNLTGLNCWGPEKARRLIELCGPKDHYLLYAYGDSRGDQELLTLSDYPSHI
jgi:HAD superfamily hydrolase (TIGR01490 family)